MCQVGHEARTQDGRTPTIVNVGAGPGGLAAAMLLANAGARVQVFERRQRVGGRCASLNEDGFRFDLGPTFFLYPRVLREIFAMVGRDLDDEVPLVKLDPQYRVDFGAGDHLDATPDLTRMEAEIARISPRDAGALVQFMEANRSKLAKFRPILESPFESVLDLFRPSTLQALPWLRPWSSVGGELSRCFTDPRLVIAFSFQAKYLGMSPFRCPSLFSILSFLEYEHGVFHPIGGCSAVSERMADIAREMGVEVFLDEPVEQLQFEGRQVTGLTTNRGHYDCDAMVINADFARAMQKLVPDRLRKRWTNRRIEKKKFSCSTFMMYLGVEGSYAEHPHHTIHIAADYDQNLADIEHHHQLSEDPSIYVQNASVTDASLAPAGHSSLYVLVPVTHQHSNVDWAVERPRFREKVLTKLESLGWTNLRSRIRFEKVVTPQDWDVDHQIHLGSTFNLAHSLDQMLHLRPHNRFEDLDGVYLVGGGTHPGSGLPVIYESARITSALMQQDLGLPGVAPALPRSESVPRRAA
ncbi:MAG: phytoene desaturase family protein [Planctomycetota bacterium]